MPVQLTEDGATGIFFDGISESFPALQWHSAEVTRMPPSAKCLATSPDCAVQAISWQTRAYSLQFHVEVEEDTFANWREIPEYAAALEKSLGSDGAAGMSLDCTNSLSEFNSIAERLYINWLQTAARV